MTGIETQSLDSSSYDLLSTLQPAQKSFKIDKYKGSVDNKTCMHLVC